eukprot:6103288-Pleurochrysis_carterae.AAC.3
MLLAGAHNSQPLVGAHALGTYPPARGHPKEPQEAHQLVQGQGDALCWAISKSWTPSLPAGAPARGHRVRQLRRPKFGKSQRRVDDDNNDDNDSNDYIDCDGNSDHQGTHPGQRVLALCRTNAQGELQPTLAKAGIAACSISHAPSTQTQLVACDVACPTLVCAFTNVVVSACLLCGGFCTSHDFIHS